MLVKSTALAILGASLSLSANAGLITYAVSDAENKHGNSIGHGLYTFGKNDTGNAKYSIQDGTFFTIDDKGTMATNDDTATLIGTAFNGRYFASINLSFSNFVETNNYKREHGKVYNPAADDIMGVIAAPGNGDIDFFETIMGSITINSTEFAIETCIDCGGTADPYGFQFGDGANAKNPHHFGGSAWVGVAPNFNGASHWDLNLKFTEVPEPSSIALIGLGLLGLGFSRRSNKAA